jgi:hypothetical protein
MVGLLLTLRGLMIREYERFPEGRSERRELEDG